MKKTVFSNDNKNDFIEAVFNDLSWAFNKEITVEQFKTVISLITVDLKILSSDSLFDTQIEEFLEDVYEQVTEQIDDLIQ